MLHVIIANQSNAQFSTGFVMSSWVQCFLHRRCCNQIFHFITCPLINAPGRKQNQETARKPRNNLLRLSYPVQLRKFLVAEQRRSTEIGMGEDLRFSPVKTTLIQKSGFNQGSEGWCFPSPAVLLSLSASCCQNAGAGWPTSAAPTKLPPCPPCRLWPPRPRRLAPARRSPDPPRTALLIPVV